MGQSWVNAERVMPRPEEVVFRLTWDGLAALCRQLAAQVAADYSPDVVVGVLRGGTLPGALIALLLRRDFHSLRVPVASSPAAHVPPRTAVDGRRVLLVDERTVDGAVLAWGAGILRQLGAREVRTLVLFGGEKGRADYAGLQIAVPVVHPWFRDVVGGEGLPPAPQEVAWLLSGA